MANNKKRAVWLSGTLVFVFGSVWIGASKLGLTTAAGNLETQLRLAKEDGLPLTYADLPLVATPKDQNGGQIILNAVEAISLLPDRPLDVADRWRSAFETNTPEYDKSRIPTDRQAATAIAELEPQLEAAESASIRPHLDFHWQPVGGGAQRGFSDTRTIVKALLAKAHVECVRRHPDIAIRSLLCSARLARLLGESPDVMAGYARHAIEADVFREGSVLMRFFPQRAVLHGIRKIVEAFGPAPDLRFELRGEFLIDRARIAQMGYADFEVTPGAFDATGAPDAWKLMRLGPISALNEANFVRYYRMEYAAVPTGVTNLQRSVEAVQAADDAMDAVTGIGSIALETQGAMKNLVDRWIDGLARRRVLLAAADILESRLKQREFPASWSKSGDDGIDPFIDKPLSYHRVGAGFVVYSFGQDRKDDDGRPYTRSDDPSRRRDISFEFPKLSIRPLDPPGSGD